MARRTRVDATWQARPRCRATQAHAGSLGGSNGRVRVVGATRVHTNARGGATWQVTGLAFEGLTGYWALIR